MWSEGTIGVPASVAGKPTAVHYWVKHYKNPSKYGINNGRISKVMLKIDGEIVCNYDRGWDIEPETEEHKLILDTLVEFFENLPLEEIPLRRG